ncbi:MAG TPA: hypothetical protein PKN32_05890 [Bacteroidales bacterium]|nr:hypothetical protein [Bacteroidales bacterium]
MRMVLKKGNVLIILICLYIQVWSQITVPITVKELGDYNRNRDLMSFMKIDLSQTWLYMVKDNVISSNRILVQEIYYNKSGLPEKIFQYDDSQKIQNFTVVKYNNQNLPFEEIKFAADSILISGVMYEYDENNLLKVQIDYKTNAEIIAIQNYTRSSDSIYVSVIDKNGVLIYKNIILLSDDTENALIKGMIKKDKNNTVFEKTVFEYDEFQSLRHKFIYDEQNQGTRRVFVYDDQGALVRAVTYGENLKVLSDSSFEYDELGNIVRIIDYESELRNTKVYFIKYLSRVN